MAKSYILPAQARNDLDEIFGYIAQDNIQAARKVRAKMIATFEKLAAHPHSGSIREDLTDQPYRFKPIHSYTIAYDPNTKPIQIVRILSSYRNLSDLL